QLVPDRLEVLQPLDRHLRAGAPARRLELDTAQPEPPLQRIARQVNVLEPRVRQADLATEEDAPAHGHALVVERVAKRPETEEPVQHRQRVQRTPAERDERVVDEEIPVRAPDTDAGRQL